VAIYYLPGNRDRLEEDVLIEARLRLKNTFPESRDVASRFRLLGLSAILIIVFSFSLFSFATLNATLV
jgi:hypothetical protein